MLALAPTPAHLITLPKRGSSRLYSAYQVFMITQTYGIPESLVIGNFASTLPPGRTSYRKPVFMGTRWRAPLLRTAHGGRSNPLDLTKPPHPQLMEDEDCEAGDHSADHTTGITTDRGFPPSRPGDLIPED